MLYLGCPIWNSKQWNGAFLPSGTTPRDSLSAYSRRLNMIEGNTTFYGMPSQDVIIRWRDETPEGFRFCLKFPRIISHDKALMECEAETAEWLACLRLLEERAGLSFLQLSRDFGPDRLPVLKRYLTSLPPDLKFAVEPRHPAWFLPGPESALNALLEKLGMARVLYDVRPLRAADPSDAETRKAQQSKPHVPVRTMRTAPLTLVRYISHPDVDANAPWLDEWEARVAGWLQEQSEVYFCMHSILEPAMPQLCRRFHESLAGRVSLPPLPDWSAVEPGAQMSLF